MPVPGVDDTQEFRSLVESMTIMGFSPEDQSGQSSSFHASPCCKTWWKKNLNLHLEKTVTNAWSIWDSCSYEKCIVFFFLFFLFFFFLWLLKTTTSFYRWLKGSSFLLFSVTSSHIKVHHGLWVFDHAYCLNVSRCIPLLWAVVSGVNHSMILEEKSCADWWDVLFCVALLRVISAVLLMGNLQFKQERNSDQATLPDNTGACQQAST